MTFTLKVKMDNAAFADNPEELKRILRTVLGKVEAYEELAKMLPGTMRVFDINGNNVGYWEIAKD